MSNLIGKTLLNRYNVREFLGRGGMADVYKVWDNQRMAFLAMKVLHEKIAQNHLFLDHFRQEAETLAKLKHPNIVRFYAFEQEGSRSFILMDFIEGETLKAKIARARKPFSLEEIREIFRPLLGALQFAHNQGLIHCDIKPANIMINKKGTLLLTDFGIARATYLDSRSLTSSGTPAYMAPEQVRNQPPIPPTDIYALGVVLFEMLTGGKRPFNGTQAQISGRTAQRIRWEQVNSPPPALSSLNPSVNPALNAIVMKCLAKESERRYQSPLALSNALGRVLEEPKEQKTSEAKAKPSPRKKRKKASKIPLILLAGVFLIGTLVFFINLISTPISFSAPDSVAPVQTQPASTEFSPPTSSVAPINPLLIRPYNQYRDTDAKTFDIDHWESLMKPGHRYYDVNFPANTKARISFGWCAKDKMTLRENLLSISDKVLIDGYEISLANFATTESEDSTGLWCKSYQAVVSGWDVGTHTYIWTQNFSNSVNDGADIYPAGEYIIEYRVKIK